MSQHPHLDRSRMAEYSEGPFSLSQYLMPYSWVPDPEKEAIILADGSVARALECTMAPTTVLSGDERQAIADQVAMTMSRWVENTTIQTLVMPTTDIDDDLRNYLANGKSTDYIISNIETRKIEFFNETRTRTMFGWKSAGIGYRTRRFRVVIVMIISPDVAGGGVSASFADTLGSLWRPVRRMFGGASSSHAVDESVTELRFKQLEERLIERLNSQCSALVSTLNAKGIRTKTMPIEGFIATIRQLIYPRSSATERPVWDPQVPLSHQIPIGDVVIDFPRGVIEADGVVHKCATLARLPQETFPGYLSAPADELNGLTVLDFLENGFMCISATVLARNEVLAQLDKREQKAKGGMATKDKVPFVLRDIEHCRRMINSEGRVILYAQTTIGIYGDTEKEAQRIIDRLREKLSLLRLDFRVEQHAMGSLWLQSIPTNFAPNIKESRRMSWMADRAVADLLPIYGMGRGTDNAMFLAHNRMGEPVRYSLFDSVNPHFCVFGASGSGKSFFVNNFIADFLRKDKTQVFCLDKGLSYATLTSILGSSGRLYRMSQASQTTINPCAGTQAIAANFVIEFVRFLVTRSASDSIDAKANSVLSHAVLNAYAEKRSGVEPYTSYQSAIAKYPKCWFHLLRKRFLIQRLGQQEEMSLSMARQSSSGREPQFTALRLARLIGHGDSKGWLTTADVNGNDKEWLEGRGIEFVNGGDISKNLNGLLILYREESTESQLQANLFHFEPLTDRMLLDCERAEDLEIAVGAGVALVMEPEFLDFMRAEFEAELDAGRHKGADQMAKKSYIDELMKAPPAGRYFDWKVGEMIVQREVFLGDIAIALKGAKEEVGLDIAQRLEPYYGQGPYAGFFDGPTGFEFNRRMICFELGELASSGAHLLSAVVGCLLQMLILYGQQDDARGHQKLLILEEFWQLLQNDLVAESVKNLFRTARKFNTAVGVVTQYITDLSGPADSSDSKYDAGRAILSGANHRFIFLQPAEIVKDVEKTIKFTPKQRMLLAGVMTQPGVFSEALYQQVDNAERCDVLRLVTNPYFYWVATTKGSDVNHRDKRIKIYKMEVGSARSHEAVHLALEECARMYPHGIDNGQRKG